MIMIVNLLSWREHHCGVILLWLPLASGQLHSAHSYPIVANRGQCCNNMVNCIMILIAMMRSNRPLSYVGRQGVRERRVISKSPVEPPVMGPRHAIYEFVVGSINEFAHRMFFFLS